ncbi:A24 family peptidase [Blastopirellula sp. JC732]|uniref:A24 family peptidase n=1 Tax=Blastopirellula sediminis TaxID=2894196 RepID=A0A9X1SHJ8_9BACT|nr:A24 family peptidase [Blastopirellula sediminis]MCC9605430.1 A24 family peptidase [Blastopirellula sediminis]MCC9631270.1 A24 family peptidase [Blastopirellula sediminis]
MDKLNFVAILLVALFTAVAFYVDLRSGKLPNWLTMPALLIGLLFHAAVSGWGGLQHSLLGAVVGFALLFVLFIIGGGGGGDVKFMAALGAWFGPVLIVIVFIVSAVLALVITVAIFVGKVMFGAKTDKEEPAETGDSNRKKLDMARQTLPYGVPVCLASWVFLLLKLVALLQTPLENG